LDYPNDFETAAFPAGKSIALSRGVAIQISIVFFLILCTCGFVLFFIRSKQNYPFLISTDPFTNEWSVVTYPGKNRNNKIEQYQIIQEKLVADYVTNWFTISKNETDNDIRWSECSVEECSLPEQFNPTNTECALYCVSDTELYSRFVQDVLPEYTARIHQASETWHVVNSNIIPILVRENFGYWQVYANIHSSVSGYFNVLVFVDINRDTDLYPVTLGYYVKDFNAYRVTQ